MTEIVAPLGLLEGIQCPDPARRFAAVCSGHIADVREVLQSCFEHARDRPNDCLGDVRGLECVAQRQSNSAAGDARR